MAVKKKFPYRSAVVACNGGCRVTAGDNGCKDGCIDCGACVEKCKFGAVSLNEYGVAEIEEEKCIGCGACGKVCPQKIIHVHECANWIVVKCSNLHFSTQAPQPIHPSCEDRSSWCKCAQSGIPCCLWICYPGLYFGFQDR